MTIVKADIVYIPVKNLSVVWVQSQRPYNEAWAKHIADNLDPDKFDPILVTKPNGEGVYHIIEGQHRRHALEMYAKSNTEQAPCRIIAEADPARAAELWLGINGGRKAVKPIHGFKVAVVAGREPEVAISKIVRSHGFKVSSEKAPSVISAVNALRVVHNVHGAVTLSSTLKTLRQMWDGDPASTTSVMIRGFGVFMNEFGPHVDPKRMMKLADKWSPHKLHLAAASYAEQRMEPVVEVLADLLFREYNKGMKAGEQKLRRKE